MRAKILAHCHPSHPSSSAAVPSSPSLSSRTALLSSPPSLLLSCLFLVGPLPHPRPSETSSRIPSRRAQAPGLWRLLFPGSPNQPFGRQRHAHNTNTTATPHTAATNEQLAHSPSLQTTCKYIASLQRGRRVASPRPTRHPAASMSAVRATALRAGGACVRCRKGKTKCVYENGRAPCKNCSKGMHECYLPSESMSHGGHGVSPARAARARETLPSERASGAATGDRHGSAHPTTVASRNSAPATEKYVCLSALSACAFFVLLVAFPSICPLVIHGVGVCVMSTLPACIPCVASAAAAGSAMTACASSGVYLSSAQLGSPPPRWSSSRATLHTQSHTIHIHLFCILVHHPPRYSPHPSWSKGSEMMHRIGVDSCARVSSGWPLHQSHFPPSPAATVPGEPGELPPVPARSIPYSNPPPSLEVIAPTLDAPGQPPTRPPSLVRE